MELTVRPIAHIRNDFATKFAVPRQSSLVNALESMIVFEPEYRSLDALRGLDGFDYIWLIWCFSENIGHKWNPTVRPPRLGGNKRMGVFATRSPFRPNPLAISCVRITGIENHRELGPVIHISGADLTNMTPIFDIKPYVSFTDSHPDAKCGFAGITEADSLEVVIPDSLLEKVAHDKREALLGILAHDMRPSYQDDPQRVYGFEFAGMEIGFTRSGDTVTVVRIANADPGKADED